MVLFNLFAAAAGCPKHTFLTLVPWYQYLTLTYNSSTQTCEVTNLALLGGHSDILLILLAVVDDLLRVAGLVAVAVIIYAGIKYITSQGAPDATAKSLSTIINGLIGLAIALVAVGVVSFLGNQLGGNGTGGTVPIVGGSQLDLSSLPNPAGVEQGDIVKTALGIIFAIIGALSLLYIVIGGFRYVVSTGDPRNVDQAKNTIMYALIGLAVAVAAESIVSGAIGRIL